jgi:hypothetical protein
MPTASAVRLPSAPVGRSYGCTRIAAFPAPRARINGRIRSYATANPKFPHETTADQWFTESQFESYRSLGLDIAKKILDDNIVLCPKTKLTFHSALSALPPTTR